MINCVIYRLPIEGKLFIKLQGSLRSLTPGQYGVFYTKDECLGSARILKPGPSLFYYNTQNDVDIAKANKQKPIN